MLNTNATIEDVYRLALPPATRLLTGREVLSRQVSWACSLRPSPPAFPKLEGNELALIDMDDLRQLDPKMRLERVVRSLESARIAAVAVAGDVSHAAVDAAQAARLALFRLPEDAPLIQIERAVIRLIVDRSGYIAQRSSELQRELNQIRARRWRTPQDRSPRTRLRPSAHRAVARRWNPRRPCRAGGLGRRRVA